MDALGTFQRKGSVQYEHEEGVVELRQEYKVVPLDSYYTGDRLMKILAEAIWGCAKDSAKAQHNRLPKAALETTWEAFNDLPLNTSGCKYWKNNTVTPFPYRQLCYSKTTRTCTLRNTPNKLTRLEFMEGVREVLGVYLKWCHMDQLMRIICTSGPVVSRKGGKAQGSKQSISKEQFITAFWPLVSAAAFEDMCNMDPNEFDLSPLTLTGCLKDISKRDKQVHKDAKQESEEDDRTSVIDYDDL